MRQFKLYNSIGKYYDLNSTESFFHDPEGLGFENDAEYERIGSQFLRTESGNETARTVRKNQVYRL